MVLAQGVEKLTALLDWLLNPDHAPLYVAPENSFFQGQGPAVELIAPSNPNDPPELVAAGKTDVAVSSQYQHQMQVEQGLPLVRIATLIATPLYPLVEPTDGPITSTADLKGKTIGSMVGDVKSALLKVILNFAVYKNGSNVCQELRR